jgi:Ser/Thr protein kinase RdoA (MazF antagonist)
LVVYAGSDSPSRKITALAVSGGADKDIVVRIADTPEAESAVRRESDALRALARSPVAGQVPRLVHEGRYGGHVVQVQDVLPGDQPQVAELKEAHFAFLVSLSKLGRATVPLSRTNLWRSLEETASRLTSDDLLDAVRAALHSVLIPEFASRPVVCHRIHGDFAPWNIHWDGRRPLVFDWEDSDPQGLALTDVYYFLYRQASEVGPWGGGRGMLRVLRDAGSRLTLAAGLPPNLQDTVLPAWLLAEYFRRPCGHIVELMAAAMRTTS